jgi:S1-C subfamily serine protease
MWAEDEDWMVPEDEQPHAAQYQFDLDHALSSVVRLHAKIDPKAFTAESLGTERDGNGVLIRDDGLVLTIGYLVTEAKEIWLTTNSGRVARAHVIAYDQPTGFGLVQALDPLDIPVMKLGTSREASLGERVLIGGAGGQHHSVSAHIVARQAFAGYWEYVLDEAIFTAPAHPNWGGAAMIGPGGDLLGIASLQVPRQVHGEQVVPLNMIVPIDLLSPILGELCEKGVSPGAARPWLGLYAAESHRSVIIIGCAKGGPAHRAGLNEGDIVVEVAGRPVDSLIDFFKAVWALGVPGVNVPLTLDREGDVFEVNITSGDRQKFLLPTRAH